MKTTVMVRKRLESIPPKLILPKALHLNKGGKHSVLPLVHSRETMNNSLVVVKPTRLKFPLIRDQDMALWTSIKENLLMQMRADKKIDLGRAEAPDSQERIGHLVRRLIPTPIISFIMRKIQTSI